MPRPLALVALSLFAAAAPGQGKKAADPPKVGETLIVGAIFPATRIGTQLATTPEQAKHVAELWMGDSDQKSQIIKECDGERTRFLRAGTKVSVLSPSDGEGILKVQCEEGPNKGSEGFVHASQVGRRSMAAPARYNPKKHSESLRRKVFETHFVLLARSLADASRKADPVKERYAFETEADKLYVKRLDGILMEIELSRDDWLNILQFGTAAGWPFEFKDR